VPANPTGFFRRVVAAAAAAAADGESILAGDLPIIPVCC